MIKFEIAPPSAPEKFTVYLEGSAEKGELSGRSIAFAVATPALVRYVMTVRQILSVILAGAVLASLAAAEQMHILDVLIGQRVKLRPLGGPNAELIINGVDQFDVSVTVVDYEHMRFVRGTGTAGYGYQQPGITNAQFKVADHRRTRIFHQDDCSVYYLSEIDTRMNHAKLEVKTGDSGNP